MRKEKTFKSRVLAWMLTLAMGLSIAPTTAFAVETPEPTEDAIPIGEEDEPVLSEELQALQECINALPTGDEYREMSVEEQDAVYETAASVSDAYFELSEEDQEKLDITKMEALFVVMNEDVSVFTEEATGNIGYEPLEISSNSLNGNAIWGLTEAWSSSITLDMSAAFYAQSSARNSGIGGLPVDGALTTTNGVPYQLATGGEQATAYDGNDCIRLYSGNTSVTMDLQTIGVYQNIYVLATAGGPGTGNYAKFNVTLNYTDGTTGETTYKLYDWYDLTTVEGVEKYYPVMRRETSGSFTGTTGTTNGPILQSATIQADSAKLLKSITFNLVGKNEETDISGLYCGIFAVTGATPAGVPEAPVAFAVTKVEGNETNGFTASWSAVDGAASYVIDVATDRKFTQIISGYNNKSLGNETSCTVDVDIESDTIYYYRVRAVNEKGQSLSSNRVSTDIPIWIKQALESDDYQKVSYDAETNTIIFKENVTLKDTITLPTEEKTVIDLGGQTITAPAGKSAIKGSGENVELLIVSTDDVNTGTIVGNGTNESGNGAPVIDFSGATGNSAIIVTKSNVTGSSGSNSENGNGGNGGVGILAGADTQIEVGPGSTITGGDGGDGASSENATGNGGAGGAGISGGNVSVSENGNVTGGDGGDATNGVGGTGGTGVSGSNVTNGGNVIGGDGGNGSSGGGAGGTAGVTNGTPGSNGSTHVHKWCYYENGNMIYAWCTQTTSEKCDYYGTEDSHENALMLTLSADNGVYSGNAYQGAGVADNGISTITKATVGDITYFLSDGTTKTTIVDNGAVSQGAAPKNAGTYMAKTVVTKGSNTYSAQETFTIEQKSIASNDMTVMISQDRYEYDGSSKTPVITVIDHTWDCTLIEEIDYELSGDTSKSELSGEDGYLITVNGKGNYKGSVEKTWRITKVLPQTETLPTASPITYGETLADSQLTDGVAMTKSGVKVEGTFTWADGTIKPTVADGGVTEYEVIFTPEDTTIFNPYSCRVKISVNPKTVILSWYQTAFTYNGKPQKPEAKVANLEEEDEGKVTVNVTVSGEHVNINTDPGYTATASLEGDAAANYKLSDTAFDNQTTFKIYPKKITVAMVTAATSYVYTGSDISPQITLADQLVNAAGQSEPKILAKGSDYTLSGDVSGKDVKSDYKLTVEGTGNYTGTVDVVWKITDDKLPTGTIKVSANSWKELLSSLSFGIFYKERQTVTITAEDEGSGVDKIYYFLTSSGTAMDQETLAALPDSKWKEISNGGTFTIDPDNKYVIYAKITDKSGNVTFISSDGIVVDKTAPAITGIENNKTYCADVTFAVSDAIGLASVKIDDGEQGIGGSYTVSASTEKAAHTIVAEDKAGNKTTFTITINADGEHSFGAWTVTTAATCGEAGVKSHTCSACGLVETQVIEKIEHDWENDAHFIWTAVKNANGVVSGYSAKAYFVCKHDSSHTSDVKTCSVTKKVTKSATEGEVVTYTAEFSDGGMSYEEIKTTNLTNLIELPDLDSPNVNSNIYTATSMAEKAPETTIDDGLDTELVKDLMSPADEANYDDVRVATDVTVYLEVQSITGAVPDTEKGKVEAQMADLVTEALNTAEDVEVESGAAYVDLSMYKNVKTEKTDDCGKTIEASDTTTQITDTGTEITITMAIPEDIPQVANGFTRTYNVVRVHDGSAEVLPSSLRENQITFKTSKFSTYAITYVDVKNASAASSSGSGTSYVPVNKVSIETAAKTLTKQGETLQLTADVAPQNATDKRIIWTSSDSSVATVDANGKVTAVGDGTVTITAKTSNGKTATITITVKIEQESEQPDSGDTDITVDTSFAALRLASSTSTKTTVTLSWTEVEGADGYVVYGAPCNTKDKTYKVEKLAVIKNGATITYKVKGLKSGTYYKYVVKAYKLVAGKKVFLARSKAVHVTTTGGKYGNAKSVKVNKTSVSLTTGKKFTIKASMVEKDKTIKQHVEIRYETSNSKVATVNSNGVITAKGKGSCYIYVYAQNGVYKRIKVTVK